MNYNDHPDYKKNETWKKIAVHDDKNVKGFFGPYRWLSNFHACKINIQEDDVIYPSSENAYQAAKVIWEYRHYFADCTPMESKSLWKEFDLIDKNAREWDNRKYGVMLNVVRAKFQQNTDLKKLLLATGDKYLEETLWWKDTFYGYDVNLKRGENNLGKILMQVRGEFNV